ncbi:MAG: hypothetical protein HRU38_25225 [Saccharospirillaceae bacterium]|nr:hypothetical protein [Saccharospirillaceae bacterium]
MKVFFVFILFVSIKSYCYELNYQSFKEADLSHPYYEDNIHGIPKVDLFLNSNGEIILVFQSMYGGDGEHTGNILKIFTLINEIPKKIYENTIENVRFNSN